MSNTPDFDTVMTSIAALSITGITVLNTNQAVGSLSGPIFRPCPDGTITGLVSRESIGGDDFEFEYDLHYDYFHCRIAADRTDIVKGLNTSLKSIIAGLLTGALNGVTEISVSIENYDPLMDEAGNTYHGAKLIIHVIQ